MQLEALIGAAVRDAVAAGELAVPSPEGVSVDRPRNPAHGDYATSVALQLARPAGLPARRVAELLAPRIAVTPGVERVQVAGPGFLNITVATAALGELARDIVMAAEAYGRNDTLAGERINLEFVSANPVGPIHIGGVRWAAVGDALARIMQASGAEVCREYYFNDAGMQIDRFARSLLAVARSEPVPDDGYAGEYLADIAEAVVKARPDVLGLPDNQAARVFAADGVALMFEEIKASLRNFGVAFDVYFSERQLHDSGAVDRAVARLRAGGHVYDADDAVWLRTTDFGEDKDRVIIKSDGSHSYLAGDVAYYLNKRERGFDRVVIMLGADHHGYVGRMRAMVAGFGEDPDQHLEILIGQMVNLLGARMSKRAGTVLTLEDMVSAVGVDAARYALARSSVDSVLTIDPAQWTRRTNDNPVFSVQYAHARTCSVARQAAEVGLTQGMFLPELLDHPREADLLGALGEFPRVVAAAAELREVHRVARYLESLAGVYHRWYDACRVLPRGDEQITDLGRTRWWLNEATRVVLANGLALLGVSAPERM
jgi:arginyl-tRNA synthetase